MKEILISQLSHQLCKFGLNPNEWLISEDQQNKNQYLLINLMDPDFKIRGSTEEKDPSQMHWSELSLISI